jgi:hypothetical protein
MRPPVTVVLLAALYVISCDKGATEATGESPPSGDTAGQADNAAGAKAEPTTAEPMAAPAPCIVGTWAANDFIARVRREMRGGVRKAGGKLSASGGNIKFEFKQDPGGAGEMVAVADDLAYFAKFDDSGVTVNANVTIKGTTIYPFELPADGVLIVNKAGTGELKMRVSIRATGAVKFTKSQSEKMWFDGEYLYECEADKLSIWDRPKDGQKKGSPLVFDRE